MKKQNFEAKLKSLISKDLNSLAKTQDGYFFGGEFMDYLLQGENIKDVHVWFKNLELVASFKDALNDTAFIEEVYKIQPKKKEF